MVRHRFRARDIALGLLAVAVVVTILMFYIWHQVESIRLGYNTLELGGHLYGAIIASLRKYKDEVESGKYGQYHLAFCAHYVGDLSQPLHNTRYNPFNKKHHRAIDRIVDDEVLGNFEKIAIYPMTITSEMDARLRTELT